ncbi:MAG: class I SAM-dependent methyltransferase [Patescibacteria group bacterium]
MKTAVAMKILAKNKEIYDQIAADFAETRNKIWPEFEYFKGYLANGQDILDLGCGNARLLELLKDYKINYLGIDFSSKLIDEAKANWPNFNFMVGDILDLNLKEKYDLVFLVATLHHIPSQKLREKVLLNVKSVLKPNGKLLMTNWNLWQKRYLKYIIKYTLLKISESENGIEDILPKDLDLQDVFIPWQKKHQRYIHAFTENNIASLLKKTGFEIIKNVSNSRNIITVAKIKEQTEKEKKKMAKLLTKI